MKPIRTCIGCRKTAESDQLYRWLCYQPENSSEFISPQISQSDGIPISSMDFCDGFIWMKISSDINLPPGRYFVGNTQKIIPSGLKNDADRYISLKVSGIVAFAQLDEAIISELLATLEYGIITPAMQINGTTRHGRGAWLHPRRECLQNAINRRAFQRSLKCDQVLWIDLTHFLSFIE